MPIARIVLTAAASTALITSMAAAPALAFGTYNSPSVLGQQAEHERITRVLQSDGFEPRTLDLLAGTSGKLGAVGAPDNPIDSSKGLGPAEKHCDNGDYLDISGYPQSRSTAAKPMSECFRYYEQLLDKAVSAAGRMVDAESVIARTEATATSCSFPFDLGRGDSSAKCEVLNRLGRALHLAEDFWSHSNWADAANPSAPVSIENPPGLGRSDIPAGLRYPGGGSAGVPDGLISGCDDSVPVLGALECKGRVTHSVLAKDNGFINAGSCSGASPTAKYARGQVTGPSGQQNFSLAVCGAMSQASATWRDLASAIRSTYGAGRGDLIVALITADRLPAAAAVLGGSESPSASPSESATASESESSSASATPTESVLESASTESEPSEPATAEPDAGEPTEVSVDREAAGVPVVAQDVVDLPSDSGSRTPMILLAVAVAMGVLAAAWYLVNRRRSGRSPS